MKYIFFGTPRFAEMVLEGLLRAGLPPAAIVCNPDRPVGRKKIITPPPVKLLAERHRIPVLQPEALASMHGILANYAPDLFVVSAYAKIIPEDILAIPRLGTVGVHPSLLPRYRGASPIQSAILHGEQETGTTIYQMDEKMDHGGVFAQSKIALDSLTTGYEELEAQLAEHSAALLIATLPAILCGDARPQAQDEAQATFTKKFKTEDGFVDEADLAAAQRREEAAADNSARRATAEAVLRKINALNPEPGVWTLRGGKRIKLLKAKIVNGALMLLIIQNEGEKAKPAA